MKKYLKKFIILQTIALLSVFISSCNSSNKVNNKISTIKVGVTVYKIDDTFISTIISNLEKSIKDIETTYDSKITLNVVDAKENQTLQNDQVDKFLAQNYNVICVNMVDRTSAATIIDKAKAVDIPIVFFNREPVEEDIRRWEKVFYVGAVATKSGILQAQIVIDEYLKDKTKVDKNNDGKIQYIMLEGEQGHQDSLIRTEYCIKAMTDQKIKMQKLATGIANWQRAQANTKMSQWIEQFGNQIEVIFCNNDDMALGAIDAFKAKEIEHLPIIVGVDGTPPALKAVKEGLMLGTVMNDSKKQAESLAKLSYLLSSGDKISENLDITNERYIMIPYKIINSNNIDKFYNEDIR